MSGHHRSQGKEDATRGNENEGGDIGDMQQYGIAGQEEISAPNKRNAI